MARTTYYFLPFSELKKDEQKLVTDLLYQLNPTVINLSLMQGVKEHQYNIVIAHRKVAGEYVYFPVGTSYQHDFDIVLDVTGVLKLLLNKALGDSTC